MNVKIKNINLLLFKWSKSSICTNGEIWNNTARFNKCATNKYTYTLVQ
jgi:hypothetical protein